MDERELGMKAYALGLRLITKGHGPGGRQLALDTNAPSGKWIWYDDLDEVADHLNDLAKKRKL
jgi:hypothetical protein